MDKIKGFTFRLRYFSFLFVLSMLLSPITPAAAWWWSVNQGDTAALELQAGVFGVTDEQSPALGLEYRAQYQVLSFLHPIAGVTGTAKGAFYGYGGFSPNFYIGQHFVIAPSLAVGYYSQGDDYDLGTPFPEFRSAMEFAYRFANRSRVGVMINHISNAGTSNRNPGTETAFLTFAWPISWWGK